MKGLKNVKADILYNSILQGDISLQNITAEEKHLLFDYLCGLIEEGVSVDEGVLEECGKDFLVSADADKIIEKTYKKLTFSKINGRSLLRRLLVAAITAVMAAVMCFGTASAFGIDIVEELHVIITSEHTVVYEEYDPNKNSVKAQRYVYSRLFEKELSGYVYPAALPDGVLPKKVIKRPHHDGRVYTLLLENSVGEYWQIFASPAKDSYMPMGYKFTADYGTVTLDYVYTVMRSSDGITGYKLYTVYNDTQYTFYLYTDDWKQVKVILENLIFP